MRKIILNVGKPYVNPPGTCAVSKIVAFLYRDRFQNVVLVKPHVEIDFTNKPTGLTEVYDSKCKAYFVRHDLFQFLIDDYGDFRWDSPLLTELPIRKDITLNYSFPSGDNFIFDHTKFNEQFNLAQLFVTIYRTNMRKDRYSLETPIRESTYGDKQEPSLWRKMKNLNQNTPKLSANLTAWRERFNR